MVNLQRINLLLMTEEPTFAVRRKKDASIVLGMKLLDNGEADGLISFGSTGAVLVSGLLIAKRMENVERYYPRPRLWLWQRSSRR